MMVSTTIPKKGKEKSAGSEPEQGVPGGMMLKWSYIGTKKQR